MTFPTMPPALSRAIAARGYDVPTAVQLAVLADDARERDLLVSAQTGSGKTVAFGLALGATLIADDEPLQRAEAPMALIIAPTRELAVQVCRELAWLYGETGAHVTACVGGTEARAEARQLAAGPHIVVGTPGRLRDHLERRRLDLSKLRAVVLDEADEMLDLGFREDLEFILDAAPVDRRTLLFSATLPRAIVTLAGRYQRDALRIETVNRNEQHADIDYWAHRVVPHDVENTVVNVLRYHEAPAALVFCSTRDAVNRLNARLIERGFASVALSGELTQQERTRALQSLRDGRARVLVATDVAARGLDLPDLALVIHAELPNDGETLLHRSGRTGRAGKKGLCVLIVPFNRRRKADAVIGAARLAVTWRPAPTPEEIYARDQERFLADPVFAMPATDDETEAAQALQQALAPEALAVALLRLRRAQFPVAEELAIDTGPPPRRERTHRDDAFDTGRAPRERKPRTDERFDGAPTKPRREDTRPMVWFQINIGREQKAEPRWLLPLLCRAGGVTRAEIGTIRVDQSETRFQILAEIADQFESYAHTNKKKEGHVVRVTDAHAASHVTPPHATAPESVEHRRTVDPNQPAGPRDETQPERKASERDAMSDQAQPPGHDERERPPRDHTSPKKAYAGTDKARPEKARPDKTRSFKARSDKPKTDRPKPDWVKSDKPKSDRPKPDWVKSDRPKSDRPKPDWVKSDRPKSDRPQSDGPKFDKPRFDKTRSDGARTDKPRSAGSRPAASRSAGPNSESPQDATGGWSPRGRPGKSPSPHASGRPASRSESRTERPPGSAKKKHRKNRPAVLANGNG